MNDFKSKLPDFKEIISITNKFYKDVKKSICEIIDDYKTKHAQKTDSDTGTTVITEKKEQVKEEKTDTKPKKRKTTKKASAESDKTE
jgi:hypothetical protein